MLAAHRAGIRLVVLPRDNVRDLDEVPATVRRAIKVVPADNLTEVLEVALL